MPTFVGTPIIQSDGGADQDESSSDNDTSETSVDSSDEDDETSDDEEENDKEGSGEKRRATRSTTASNNNEKPKGRVTRQKAKEQTNVPTKRLLRSRKKSPVAGSGSKQPQVFPCPDCKKEFTSKVSVNKHRQWCKPKSTKASPRKKSETKGGSSKQDKPKQQEQKQQPAVTVTPDKPRGRGRPRKSQVDPTPPSVVEVPKLPVEHVQSEIIEDGFIHLRSPESSPGIPDTSSESDYEQREFAANVHVNNRGSNVTIDVVNPDPPFDPNQSFAANVHENNRSSNVTIDVVNPDPHFDQNQAFAANQVESENGPVQCSRCKMTYRTAQGYQKHVPTCMPYSSSDEDEDAEVDVQGFSENNEVQTRVDQLSIRETTRVENTLVQNQEKVIPQTSNEPTYASSSEESSSMEDNESLKNKTENIRPQEQDSNPENHKMLTVDSVSDEIADSKSSQLPITQKDEDKSKLTPETNERMSENSVIIDCFNANNAEQLHHHANVPMPLEKVENTQPEPQQPHHWENSHQRSPLKGAIVLPASQPNESHVSVVPSITNNHENLPPPPIHQPLSADHVSHVQYQQERYNTLLPARTETQSYNPIMSSNSSNISVTTVSAPQQYFQQTHQNTPTYTQAQLMPGTVVNSVQMQQMSTSFPTQDSTPTPHLQANNFPVSVNASYMSSHNLIRAPNCVPNVITSLPPVQPNAVIGNPSQYQHPHVFRSIDQRMPPPAQQQQQQGPPQQQFSAFPQQLPPNFPHFQGQVGPSFAQQQFAYGNGGNIVSYGSSNNMQVTVSTPQQQLQSNGLQLQQNQIPQTIDSPQSKQLRLQQIPSVPSQAHVMANQQGLTTQHMQANGSQISIEGVQHHMHPALNNFQVPQHQLPPSQFYQNQTQAQKLNVGNMAMLMQNGFNGQNAFAVGGNNQNNPHPVPGVPYQLQQQGQGSQISQPFVHQGQTTSLIHSMAQSQQDPNLGHCVPNPAHPMQNNYSSMLQNTGSHASQSINPNQELQQQPQVHQQLYQGGHIVPLMQQSQNAQLQLQIQQQQELQRQLQAQQNSQTTMGQWNKPDISTNLDQTHQQTTIGDNSAVPQLQISSLQNSAATQQQLQTNNPTAVVQQQLQANNSTAIAQQVQPSSSTVIGQQQQQTQQSQVTPFIQQIAQLADGSTVILLTPAQPQNNTPGMIPQSVVVSTNNSFQQTGNVLNLLPGLQNIACQQQQQHSPQLSPQTIQCSLTSNTANGVVPHVGSVGRSAPCPCPACKEKAVTANALEKYKKVLPYPSDHGKQRQSSLNPRPIMIRPGPGKPQRTIRIQKAVMQSPNGNVVVSVQQPQQQNSALPPMRLVPLITKTVPQAVGMGVMMGSTETTNSVINRAPISSANIAVVRPMENPLQKLSDQISQIESTFMAPQQQQQTTQPTVQTMMPQGPHLTLVTVSPPPSLINSPARSPQIVASAEVFSVATGSPIQQQVTQLLEMTKSGTSMDLNAMPEPRLTLVDHGTTSSASLPSPSKTAVVRNGTLAGVKRKTPPTATESGPNKSIKVTLRRKEGGDSYSINRITGSASGKGTMKSLKIKGQIKSGEQAGTLTDVVVVPVIHTVPIPDPDGDETESNRTIAEDGSSLPNGIALTPSLIELPVGSAEETSGESLRLTHRAVIVYEVQSNDTVLFRSSDVRAVWGYIFETVQGTRLNHNLPPLSYPATNISLPQNEQEADASFNKMGLTHRAVQFLLEQLPGMKALASDFKFVKPASPNQLEEEPIQENESGCARTEIFTGRKPFDMFGWLASKHRKAPDATVCNMPLESAKNMAAPLSMRYRKLKEKVDTSLVVWWSTVHGRGLYTKRDIEKGEMIIEYAGEVIRPHVCDAREKYYESKSIGCYMFRINDQVIDATMKGNAARFINHSCEPNCEAKAVKISGKAHILIFALRRVSRGEELTYDYKFEKEEEKIPCTCGSKHCRKYLN
ncbi:unnamed protein product [Orchesella dallaii]|uniref:Histone-lysine N-methyltransferase trithorax n=1 Tax=Orchesella dallaii TaxID=48710 RepID=A0ABP1R1B1_9HEXA